VSEPELVASAQKLAEAIRRTKVNDRHLLSDFILVGLATDTCDQAFATHQLAQFSKPRTAYANARAAFETALEMRLLVSSREKFDAFCANLRVFELFEFATLSGRAPVVAQPLPALEIHAKIEAIVREDAKGWDAKAPGQGEHILAAWQRLSSTVSSRANHWSGKSRLAMIRESETATPDSEERLKEFDYLWGQLSMEAHPRARIGGRQLAIEDGRIFMGSDEVHRTLPSLAALVACEEATRALAVRHGWDALGA